MKTISALLFMFLLGCSHGDSNKNFEAVSEMPEAEAMEDVLMPQDVGTTPSELQEQKIIKTAQLPLKPTM